MQRQLYLQLHLLWWYRFLHLLQLRLLLPASAGRARSRAARGIADTLNWLRRGAVHLCGTYLGGKEPVNA